MSQPAAATTAVRVPADIVTIDGPHLIPGESVSPGEAVIDPLRLAACPACTYDLTGLPDVGHCPECGEAYDRDADEVVFFGTADGQLATVASGGRGAVAAHVAIFAMLFALWLLIGRGNIWDYVGSDPFLLLMLGFIGLQFVLMLSIRATAAAVGLVRVRIGAAGFEQSSTVPPDTLAWRLLNAVRVVSFVCGAGYVVAQGLSARFAVLWVIMAMAAVNFVAQTWRRLTDRTEAALAADDRMHPRTGALQPWSTVRQAEVNSRRDGRFRLYLSGAGWFNPVDYVNAILPIRRD